MFKFKINSRCVERILNRRILASPSLSQRFQSSKDPDYGSNESQLNQQIENQKFSFLTAFAKTGKRKFPDLHRLNPFTVSPQRLREWKERHFRESEKYQQRYIQLRHDVLQNDLASAHFLVYRGAQIKFTGHSDWIYLEPKEKICEELPCRYDSAYQLEAIDMSNTNILYEGLENLVGLKHLKWLSLKNCSHIDDWYLDRITRLFYNSLEYLDISDCPNLTERSLSCLYRLDKIKTLVIENTANNRLFELGCLLVEEANPSLTIEGVKYMSITE